MNDYRITAPTKLVNPRKNSYKDLSIIAVDYSEQIVWTETRQYAQPLEQLPRIVLEEPDSILVGYEVGLCVKQIADDFANCSTFQIKVTPIERELAPWRRTEIIVDDNGAPIRLDSDTPQRTVVHGVSFAFVGWKNGPRKGWRTRHYPVDPLLFTSSFKPEYKTADRSLRAVIDWTIAVREFLEANDLEFRATQSGIAAQLLRDKRFYPDPRRKIPKATNARARGNLPGNYYFHNADKKIIYNALEVDQRSSHHSCARDLTFPNAAKLYAKGYFKSLEDKPYAVRGTVLFERLIAQHGLFYLKVKVPTRGLARLAYPIPAADYVGTDADGCALVYVYSNELEELIATGTRIEYIVAAWTSAETCDGLNKFAQWALEELAKSSPERKRWLKPLLLSAYGLLATKPRPIRSGYFTGDGERTHYHIGRGQVMKFVKHETQRPFEPGFVNVVHRGMIEAETRLRSLRMARHLESFGFRVLVVYADAVFVDRGAQLPLLSDDWETKEITGASFPQTNQIVCDQYSKLPGASGKRRQVLINEIRERVTA